LRARMGHHQVRALLGVRPPIDSSCLASSLLLVRSSVPKVLHITLCRLC